MVLLRISYYIITHQHASFLAGQGSNRTIYLTEAGETKGTYKTSKLIKVGVGLRGQPIPFTERAIHRVIKTTSIQNSSLAYSTSEASDVTTNEPSEGSI